MRRVTKEVTRGESRQESHERRVIKRESRGGVTRGKSCGESLEERVTRRGSLVQSHEEKVSCSESRREFRGKGYERSLEVRVTREVSRSESRGESLEVRVTREESRGLPRGESRGEGLESWRIAEVRNNSPPCSRDFRALL